VEVIGVEHPEMRAIAGSYGLNGCIRFVGGLPYLDTMSRLAQSDVLLVIEAPCEEGVFLPSKVADYACLGKPILAVSPPIGTLNDLLSDCGGGLCVDNRSSVKIADGLRTLYCRWRENRRDVPDGEKLRHMFSPDAVASMYERLFADLWVRSLP
jgi:glycosyltransferase involved in cell wall biosynthesis